MAPYYLAVVFLYAVFSELVPVRWAGPRDAAKQASAVETCVSYDPRAVRAMKVNDGAWLVSDGKRLRLPAASENDAGHIALVATAHTGTCVVGSGRYSGRYWTGAGYKSLPPAKSDPHCSGYDPKNLKLIQQNNLYIVANGREAAFAAPDKAVAEKMLAVFAEHTFRCAVGGGNQNRDYIIHYWR